MNHQISDVKFFQGGRALFTVANGKGEHYTFKIRQPKGDNKPFFVSLLTGPNNEGDYTYLGIYNPNDHKVFLTAKSKMNENSTPVKVINWAIGIVASGKTLPEGYSIQHEGRCCRCGRLLTDPTSIELGIGPECGKRF
jgi:hypothetical protein